MITVLVPREVTRWALRKAGVEEWLVNAVMAMYDGAQTVVRTTEGDSNCIRREGTITSRICFESLLFVTVMKTRNSAIADKPCDTFRDI